MSPDAERRARAAYRPGVPEGRDDLLVTAEWLVAHHADADVRVLDPRRSDAFESGHVPGSLSANTPFKDPDRPLHVMTPAQAGAAIRALGISNDTQVVIVGEGMLAGRLWWFLRYHGHEHVRVSDGEFSGYVAAGGPVTRDAATVAPGTFTASVVTSLIVRSDELVRELHGRTRILDVRSDAEWHGSNNFDHARVGHIPGARHLVWTELLEPEPPHRFRPPAEIRALLASKGIAPRERVVTVCEVGWRAAHAAFALRIAGFEDVRVYDASMREWDNVTTLPLEPPPPA